MPNETQFKMNFYRAVLGNIQSTWTVSPEVLRLLSPDYQQGDWRYGDRTRSKRRLVHVAIDGQTEGTAKLEIDFCASCSYIH